jgi:hypothetical protein
VLLCVVLVVNNDGNCGNIVTVPEMASLFYF